MSVHLCSCFDSITLPGIDVGGYPISAARDLGVLVDSYLSMSKHVNRVCPHSFLLVTLEGLDRDNCEKLLHAFISSKLDSCNSLFAGLPDKEISKLHRVQNAAVRLIVSAAYVTHIRATTLVALKVQNRF